MIMKKLINLVVINKIKLKTFKNKKDKKIFCKYKFYLL